MPYGLYVSAEGVQAQAKRMEVLANNLANVNTVGFKRDHAIFQARFAEAIDRGTVSPGMGGIDDIGGGITVAETKTEFRPGPLKITNVPTDVAIEGDGFFQVRKGDTTLLTRAGDFRLDAAGTLLTQNGYPVLGDNGSPITLSPDLPFAITSDGTVQQGETNVALALVRPVSQGDLVKQGENFFLPLARTRPVPATERRVAAGTLELSGVNPTTAMLELIETSRATEANMKMIQNQDHMMGSLISRVLASS